MPSVISTPTHPATADSAAAKRTITIPHAHGPFVVDVWDARQPADVPPILLIHGWGGSGSYWTNTACTLSATATVIVPDLPGTGRSLPVSQPQDMFAQVASLIALLDELGLEQVQVVGHSMGSAMALLLADAVPDRVERIVMTSMCFFINEKQEQMYKSVMTFTQLFMNFRPKILAEIPGMSWLMATRYFYRVPKDKALLRDGLMDYLTLDYGTAVACSTDAVSPAIPEAGARLTVPTLLIACRQDQVMPVENVEYTAEIIPNCDIRWINRCGHLPMVEKPDEYLSLLHEFLQH